MTALCAATLAAVLVTGTLVTGAGPHAGDKSATRTVARLKVEVATLAHLHESLLIAFLGLLVGLCFALAAVRAAKVVIRRLALVIALTFAQGVIGVVNTSPAYRRCW